MYRRNRASERDEILRSDSGGYGWDRQPAPQYGGVEVAIFLYELEPQTFKVSMRSDKKVDVSSIARLFGGGGHIRAAGCTMNGNPFDVVNNLTLYIERQLLKVTESNMIHGVLNVYKEAGFTSHDVVAKLRGILKQKKIGHTGTLDPDAVGVLPVCLGKGTRVCDMLTDESKTYEAVLLLGQSTDTQDTSGKVLKRQSRRRIRKDPVLHRRF